jgi:hypothetical protein
VLAGHDAVRLFVERAAAARPDFALDVERADAVAEICRRLDGMPLAIELAAARTGMLAVDQLAARLDDRFGLLTGGRASLPRQQTLRATIDWSYELLAPPERTLFGRLAVFVGGWTLDAAEQVCAGRELARGQVLDVLGRLVDRSLVTATPGPVALGCWKRSGYTPGNAWPSPVRPKSWTAATPATSSSWPSGRSCTAPGSRAGWRVWTPSMTTCVRPSTGPRPTVSMTWRCGWPGPCTPPP